MKRWSKPSASDRSSPAFEARLEARRAAQADDDERLRPIATVVLGGLAAVALAALLVRSLVRIER